MARILTDQPREERDALRPLANGKLVAFGKWLFGVFLAAVAAYYSAQITTENRITRVETMLEAIQKDIQTKIDANKAIQEANFKEILRSLDRMEAVQLRQGAGR